MLNDGRIAILSDNSLVDKILYSALMDEAMAAITDCDGLNVDHPSKKVVDIVDFMSFKVLIKPCRLSDDPAAMAMIFRYITSRLSNSDSPVIT